MTVDALAARMDVGCDYCGARTELERYEPITSLAWGFRCSDADECDRRELAQNIRGARVTDLFSVRHDFRPDPTVAEDRERLAAWLEDIRFTDGERALHGRDRGSAKRIGPAALAEWHAYHARLHKELMDRHEWCVEILRREAARVDDRLAAEREEK